MIEVKNSNPVYSVTVNEFIKLRSNPLILIMSCILFILASLNGLASPYVLSSFTTNNDVFIRAGLGDMFYRISLLCTIVAAFLGVMSIAEDRSKSLFKVLLTKPLYKRDIVLGKFCGICLFLLMLIGISYIISSLLVMIFYGLPQSILEFILRIISLILALFLECALTAGITMMIGIIFKNLLEAVSIVATCLFIDWYGNLYGYIGNLSIISPRVLYFDIFNVNNQILLIDTSIPYMNWLNAAAPYIVLVILEITAIVILDCFMIIKTDEI